MRVLLAGHIRQPFGGIATYCEDLLSSRLREIVSLTFVETSGGKLQVGERGRWRISNLFNALGNILSFISAIIKTKPDLVHITTAYGASFVKHGIMVMIARSVGLRVILQPHCALSKVLRADSRFWRDLALFILGRCDAVLVLSREWLVLQKLVGCPVSYVPNAINLRPYLGIERAEKCPAQGEKKRILYIGHFVYEKGTFELIEATRILASRLASTFTVCLIGEAATPGDMNKINESISVSQLGEWISIFPPKFSEEKLDAFAIADALVLPSHHEGMPIAIIEAMASGLPVIATPVGGIPELVISGETGFLVPVSDPRSLADAMQSLVCDPRLRLQMGRSARTRAIQHFNIDDRAVEIALLYKKTLESSGR